MKDDTSSIEIISKNYRNFMFILYPEWKNFDDILLFIRGNFKKYAYCYHQPESDNKKEHVHLIISLDNPTSISGICKKVNVPINLCEPIRGLRGACRYLIHKDEEDKIQYDISDVHFSNAFKSTFLKAFDDLLSDDEILDRIYEFIEDNSQEFSSIEMEMQLSRYCISNNFSSIFKRYYNTICKYIVYQCKNDLTFINK